jgi:hypothetical protein
VAATQRWTIGPLAASAKNGSPAVAASTPSSHGTGLPEAGGSADGTATGSTTAASTSMTICSGAWRRAGRRLVTCAKA